MKNQQGAPEALRTVTRYEVVDCIDSKHVPAVIPNKDGPWVRYEDHLAALVEAQQPAPSAAAAEAQEADAVAKRRAKYLRNDTDAGRAYVAQYLRSMGQHYFDDYIQTDLAGDFACALASALSLSMAQQVPQPSPTPQADSQPAADEIVSVAREQGLPETEIAGVFRVNADDLCRVVAADRAARAPADSVTAPAGGVVVTDDMVLAALRVQYPGAYGQYLRHPANGPKTSLRTESEIDTARRMLVAALAATPTPPAQAADSVLEDAALPMQPICVTADGVVRFKKNRMVNDMYEFSQPRGFGLNEMARRDYTQEERMQFAQLIGYSVSGYGGLSYASPESAAKADTMAEALLAARKQGANHD